MSDIASELALAIQNVFHGFEFCDSNKDCILDTLNGHADFTDILQHLSQDSLNEIFSNVKTKKLNNNGFMIE